MTQVLSLSADTARWSVLAALADTIILTGNWRTASRAAPTARQMSCPQTSAQQDILPTAFFQSSNDAGSRQLTPENGTWSWTTGIPPTAGSLAETKMRVRVYSCLLVSDQTGGAIGSKPALKGLLKKAYAAIICSGYAHCLQRKKSEDDDKCTVTGENRRRNWLWCQNVFKVGVLRVLKAGLCAELALQSNSSCSPSKPAVLTWSFFELLHSSKTTKKRCMNCKEPR